MDCKSLEVQSGLLFLLSCKVRYSLNVLWSFFLLGENLDGNIKLLCVLLVQPSIVCPRFWFSRQYFF